MQPRTASSKVVQVFDVQQLNGGRQRPVPRCIDECAHLYSCGVPQDQAHHCLQAVREYEEQYQTVWREQQEAALAGISSQLPGALLPSPLAEPASTPCLMPSDSLLRWL